MIQPDVIALAPVVRKVVATFRATAEREGIQLTAAIAQEPLLVFADEARLQQVGWNLVSNAIKFTPRGGRISVTCAEREGNVEISVADSGIGIPADKLHRIFEPFVQVDTRLTRTQEGVGLGLAISRDLARAMGGSLMVESEEGKGSVFTLVLPGKTEKREASSVSVIA
jgi:signal transduction histidine kinase